LVVVAPVGFVVVGVATVEEATIVEVVQDGTFTAWDSVTRTDKVTRMVTTGYFMFKV